MSLITLIKSVYPEHNETNQDYQDRLKRISPKIQKAVHEDLDRLNRNAMSIVIIDLRELHNQFELSISNNEILFAKFIQHHLAQYETACEECGEIFNSY